MSCYYLREVDNNIEKVGIPFFKSFIMEFLKTISRLEIVYGDLELTVNRNELIEKYLRQSHLVLNDTFLQHLETHTKLILKDDANTTWFPFTNKIVKVTKNKIESMDHSEMEQNCIWKSHIISGDFDYERQNEERTR